MSTLSSKSVMLIGDLNARVSCNQVNTLTNINNSALINANNNRTSKDIVCNQNGKQLLEMLQMFDSIILNGCTEGDLDGQFTFIGGQGNSVNDYCTVNNDWIDRICKFEVLTKNFSDHMPLVVEWKSEIEPQYRRLDLIPRLKWRNINMQTFHHSLDSSISRILSTHEETTEALSNQITECIRNSTKNLNSKVLKPFKQKWFDRECLNARNKSFTLLNAFRNSPSEELRKWYLECNVKYKNLCFTKKVNFETMQAQALSQTKNTKQFWNMAKEINGSNHMIGSSISADDLSIYFKNLLQNNLTYNFSYAEPFTCDVILDSEISAEEVQSVLRNAKDDKAPGEDGIPYEFFKYATLNFHNHLVALFNKILMNSEIPSSFKKSVIFPIHKKGCLNAVENYRGISFMNVIAKIFCGVLAGRLERWVETNNILTDFQAGFRKNYSTVDHIFALASLVQAFRARNKKVYALFIDFKSAFDLVNRNALMYKLSQIGVSTRFLTTIRNMYTDTEAAVWDGALYSEAFKTDTGVKQGCPLSALLFSLFINDIVTHLPGGIRIANTTINVLLYADDLLILSESPENLQLMINRLSEYCSKWGLVINTEKSKVMVFSRTTRGEVRYNWMLNGRRLEVTKDYKYLGIKLNPTLDFRQHLTDKANVSQSLINITWRKIFANQHINLSTKYTIFNSVVKSTLCYGAQVWGMDEYDEIEKLQRNFVKKIFNLPTTVPTYAIYLETGLPKLYTSTLKLQADYIIKVCGQGESRLSKIMLLYEIRNKDWWLSKWQSIGAACGENLQINPSNIQFLKEQLYKIIQKTEDNVRNQLIEKACESDSRILYSQLNYNLCDTNYFRDSMHFKDISLIFKARSEVLYLNGSPYNGSYNQFCDLCNQKAKEDCFHFLSICPVFMQQRITYFGKRALTMQETIDVLNGAHWTNLANYLKDSYRYRKLLLSEYA